MTFPFIVLYGAPNLGKTEQSKRLADTFNANYIKYPVYDLKDTGPEINDILRNGVYSSPLELQKLFAQNRRDFEPILKTVLTYRSVIGEAYIGTGIAHGMSEGISQEILEEINKQLLLPDLSILLDGETRFSSGIERNHRFEDFEKEKNWENIRNIHRELAQAYGWEVVNANQEMESVHQDILNIVNVYFPHE